MGWADKLANKVSVSYDEWQEAMKNQERVCVIESDCYLDDSLKTLLEFIFTLWNKEVRQQFNPEAGGSLVSLTHKARLVYSLGYIDKTTLDDLKQMHNIRNHFAHNVNITFTDTKVCKMVEALSVVKDSKVTTMNSLTIRANYLGALEKCLKAINTGIKQEVFRKAALEQAKKEKSKQETK